MPFYSYTLSPLLGLLLVAAVALLAFALAATVARFLRRPRPVTAVAVVLLALGLTCAGTVGYAEFRGQELLNTWHFAYELDIQGNGTAPESIVVPIVSDESLLAGLHLTSGTANWSIVDSSRGRGLFVRFMHSARIETSMSAFPPPAVLPNTNPTMIVPTNCTTQPSNCTGPPSVWAYYSGSAGASVTLSVGSLYFSTYVAVGWASYRTWPVPVPLS